MKNVLIIGCGDIGVRIAGICQQQGASIYGLVRSTDSTNRLQALNITPIIGNLDHLSSLKGLFDYISAELVIYYLAPPPSDGQTDRYIRNFLASFSENIPQKPLPIKIVQISTTAVYGDCQGAWITEDQPVNPQTDRGLRRVDAENALREWSANTGVPVVTLRVGGIYGAGRLPIERLKKGLPILKEEESPFTNRIHQDDLAQICVAAAEYGKPGEVYNVSDGHPSTMSYYFKAVAKKCGLAQPPEVSKAEAEKVMTAGMLSYLKESRRLDNKKLINDLHITLRYPTLEDGL